MNIKKAIWVLLLMLITARADAQKQLVLLKKENVLLRLYPGDDFIYRLKGSKAIRSTYVNNISDTAVVTHSDTVPFRRIDRLYFRQPKFYNRVGRALVIFGAGFFLVDQVNVVIVNGNKPDLDNRVSAISLSSLAAGLPLMLIRKKSQKLQYPIRLMMVDKGSAFYRPDTREIISNEN